MRRTDRLFEILQILRDGRLHRAEDIARKMAVSTRTIYRDMERLQASGLPLSGTRGAGYTITQAVTLPPLTLSGDEVEALNLGIAIVAESADPALRAAALSLADKIDAAQPSQGAADAQTAADADHPFASAAHGFAQMPTLRAAIRARQKLLLVYTGTDGTVTRRTIRPLLLDYWGRIWSLTAWCELRRDFRVFRVDLIETAQALPQMFVDEPGKRISDFKRS